MIVKFPDCNELMKDVKNPHVLASSTQVTYVSETTVYQYPPILAVPVPPFLLRIISRWLLPLKAQLLAERTNRAQELSQELLNSISVPYVVPYQGGWCTSYQEGCQTLEEWCNGCINDRKAIVLLHGVFLKFLVALHRSNFLDAATKIRGQYDLENLSLRDYYKLRLRDIIESINYILKGGHSLAQKLVKVKDESQMYLEVVDSVINDYEKVKVVHGDYSPSTNLLVSMNKELFVIDFEQGLLGGDPITDIQSFRLLSVSSRLKKILFPSECNLLLAEYCRELGIETRIPEDRTKLIRFDRLVSTLIFKLLAEGKAGNRPLHAPPSYRQASEVIDLIVVRE